MVASTGANRRKAPEPQRSLAAVITVQAFRSLPVDVFASLGDGDLDLSRDEDGVEAAPEDGPEYGNGRADAAEVHFEHAEDAEDGRVPGVVKGRVG